MRQRSSSGAVHANREGQPPYLYPDYVATRLRAPRKPLIILPKTLSDTTGPAYGRGPIGELDNDLSPGEPVPDAMVEIRQANRAGL